MKTHRPPRLATLLLWLALPRDEREFVLGDLEERWGERLGGDDGPGGRGARSGGRRVAARAWYWAQVLRSCRHALAARITRTPDGRIPAPSTDHPVSAPSRSRESPMHSLMHDLRYALRAFVSRPGFALTAAALMGLGIGATTTIFSVVDTVLLRPLPYPDPERLVFFDNRPHAFPYFTEWRDNLTSVSAIGALTNAEGSVSGDEGPAHVWIAKVTQDLLPMLGAQPRLGRFFVDADHQGGSPVAVLDHAFWQQRWGSDPGIVGRQIRLDGEPVVVAGVLGPDFTPPEALTASGQVDVWLPVDETDPAQQNRNTLTFGVVARLRDEVSIEAAQAEVDALTASLAEELPDAFVYPDGTLVSFPLVFLREATVRRVSDTLLMLLGAVGLMLLIACANVANLFLARGTARTGEIALRGALGASRGRIIRQLLTESAALALVGGVGGVGLAYLGVDLFIRFGPGDIPRLAGVTVDPRILLFALLASVGTGVLCGVFPALQATRRSAIDDLREATANATTGRRRRNLRSGLVITELALTVVLLTGAGLLFRSMLERIRVDPGFRAEELVVLPLELGASYSREKRGQFASDLRERIGDIPGTEAVAAGWTLPLVFPPRVCCWTGAVRPVGAATDDNVPTTFIHPVTPDYFRALGVAMKYGREFTDTDADVGMDVAVINARLAQRLFGTEDAAGRRLMIGDGGSVLVVGVEPDVHHWGLDQEVDEALYLPYEREGTFLGLFHVGVRSTLPLPTLAPALREAVRALDSDMATDEIIPMRQLISRSLATPRFLSILLGTFAILALLLACGGIYASMLYTVGQRRREMGIRLALGADTRQVSGMVLKDGALLTALGLTVGIGGALALSRLMAGFVWGVSPTDATTYILVCVLLSAAAGLACWIPARRASRTDLVTTLKVE